MGVGAIAAELDQADRAIASGRCGRGSPRPGPARGLSDISHAVERSVRAAGAYGIVEEYVGHGIGTEMHMDPPVPNYGQPGRGPVLRAGMALAIEPLLVLGGPDTRLLADDWTVVSEDGSWSAHFEHTVAVTADGPWVLTASAPPGPVCSPRPLRRAGQVPAGPTLPVRVPAGRAAKPVPRRDHRRCRGTRAATAG